MKTILRLLSYPKALIGTVLAIVITLVLSIVSIVGVYLGGGKRFADFILRYWARLVSAVFLIRLKVYGEENLPDEGVLFVFNHTSFFDIIAISGGVNKSARYGAKIELFKVPFFGRAMSAFGILPIARKQREKVLKLYEESIVRVKDGESFILAGEGGRHSGRGVGEKFKAGPFIFSISGQFPIVPVVLKGCHEVMSNKGLPIPAWGLWSPVIEVHILPKEESVGYTMDTRVEYQDLVHHKMLDYFEEIDH